MRHLFSSRIPSADKNMILAPKFLFLGPFAIVIRMVWNPHILWLISNAKYQIHSTQNGDKLISHYKIINTCISLTLFHWIPPKRLLSSDTSFLSCMIYFFLFEAVS